MGCKTGQAMDQHLYLHPPHNDSEESSSSSSSVHGDDDLFCGKEISQDLENAPKEELFRLLRLKGHMPMQRNSRPGNIQVLCKACDGRCSTSTYRRNAWYVTSVTREIRRQCMHATPSAVEIRSEPSRMWSVGGVWWCMVVYVFNCNLPVAEVVLKRPIKKGAEGRPPTGVWWCMAYIMYNVTRHLQPEQSQGA